MGEREKVMFLGLFFFVFHCHRLQYFLLIRFTKVYFHCETEIEFFTFILGEDV